MGWARAVVRVQARVTSAYDTTKTRAQIGRPAAAGQISPVRQNTSLSNVNSGVCAKPVHWKATQRGALRKVTGDILQEAGDEGERVDCAVFARGGAQRW